MAAAKSRASSGEPEGVRVKFRMKRNSIKMYDKWSVLRIETTIQDIDWINEDADDTHRLYRAASRLAPQTQEEGGGGYRAP